MSENKPVQLGLCCISLTLQKRKPPVIPHRSIKMATLKAKGVEFLKEKIKENLKDQVKLLEWNEQMGIKVLRLHSEIMPHKGNSQVDDFNIDFSIPLLKEIGDTARKYNHRLTFHPGQYNVVGTPDPTKFKHTIRDLKYQCDLLDFMGMGVDSVVVIHGGGLYGDKESTIKRWCEQFQKLPTNVQSRLVIENCEKSFSVLDCLQISKNVNIPVVFDTHHFDCYVKLHPKEEFKPPEEYMKDVLKTWKRRGIKPKFHVSEQDVDGIIGKHSTYIETIPAYLLEIPDKYGVDIDIMIEAKRKEYAIFQLYHKYPHLNCKKNPDQMKTYQDVILADKKWLEREKKRECLKIEALKTAKLKEKEEKRKAAKTEKLQKKSLKHKSSTVEKMSNTSFLKKSKKKSIKYMSK